MPFDMSTKTVSNAEFEEVSTIAAEITNILANTLDKTVNAKYPDGSPENEALRGLVIGALAEDYTRRFPDSFIEFGKMLVGHTIVGMIGASGPRAE